MRNWKLLVGASVLGMFFLAGCTAQLSQADRDLMNQAITASHGAAASEQKAESAANRADAAAQKAEDAAGRAESAAMKAETAAGRAEAAAGNAEQSAQKAEKAFEMRLKK